MSADRKTRIVIIEPSPVIRQGLRSLLETPAGEWSIAGDYGDLQQFRKDKPDRPFEIMLINPSLVGMYRPFNVRELFPDHPDILIVAIHYRYAAPGTLDSFNGMLDIYDQGETMMKKLKRIAGDRSRRQQDGGSSVALSEREKEILVAVARGMANKEIADKHCISVHTVISHRKNITRKTGIKTVSGLTVYALFNDLVQQGEL